MTTSENRLLNAQFLATSIMQMKCDLEHERNCLMFQLHKVSILPKKKVVEYDTSSLSVKQCLELARITRMEIDRLNTNMLALKVEKSHNTFLLDLIEAKARSFPGVVFTKQDNEESRPPKAAHVAMQLSADIQRCFNEMLESLAQQTKTKRQQHTSVKCSTLEDIYNALCFLHLPFLSVRNELERLSNDDSIESDWSELYDIVNSIRY